MWFFSKQTTLKEGSPKQASRERNEVPPMVEVKTRLFMKSGDRREGTGAWSHIHLPIFFDPKKEFSRDDKNRTVDLLFRVVLPGTLGGGDYVLTDCFPNDLQQGNLFRTTPVWE